MIINNVILIPNDVIPIPNDVMHIPNIMFDAKLILYLLCLSGSYIFGTAYI